MTPEEPQMYWRSFQGPVGVTALLPNSGFNQRNSALICFPVFHMGLTCNDLFKETEGSLLLENSCRNEEVSHGLLRLPVIAYPLFPTFQCLQPPWCPALRPHLYRKLRSSLTSYCSTHPHLTPCKSLDPLPRGFGMQQQNSPKSQTLFRLFSLLFSK